MLPSIIVIFLSFIYLSTFIYKSYDLNKNIDNKIIKEYITGNILVQFKRKYSKKCYSKLLESLGLNKKEKLQKLQKYDLYYSLESYNYCYVNY